MRPISDRPISIADRPISVANIRHVNSKEPSKYFVAVSPNDENYDAELVKCVEEFVPVDYLDITIENTVKEARGLLRLSKQICLDLEERGVSDLESKKLQEIENLLGKILVLEDSVASIKAVKECKDRRVLSLEVAIKNLKLAAPQILLELFKDDKLLKSTYELENYLFKIIDDPSSEDKKEKLNKICLKASTLINELVNISAGNHGEHEKKCEGKDSSLKVEIIAAKLLMMSDIANDATDRANKLYKEKYKNKLIVILLDSYEQYFKRIEKNPAASAT